ncbi:ABC transporter ATP-binding protein [Micromonospora sp. HM5-17]|jgi:ABC-type glutathione transport system ATPase component|uniref:dipeptide ABC transporter ATP-binding protein n=1 Tax=Micromonospora sp. HM5-17 TaxID=2487710 RepID=UPI000F4A6672|nr:ABC transporter ATP-binding protein [Micromonospora sp. HM5-17]ROT33287.1 ABC transporter ATP-binding protein [Micromonospora sp. HM5-17]
MTILAAEDLSVSAPDGTLVSGVNLRLDAGDRVGLIGESGSGKSLTALALLGLLPDGMRASGRVVVDGRDLLGRPDREWRRVRGRTLGVVFQEPLTALDPLMPVGRQLTGPLRMHHGLNRADAEAEAVRWLARVHLPDPARLARALPHQLSGGQRQRVAIAMALACRPRVLIADEPTTALDVTVQAQVLELLGELVAQTGVALLFISHDLPVVAGLARDLVVMRHGRVVESGSVDDVLRRPRSGYARRLVRSALAVTRLAGQAVPAGPEPTAAAAPERPAEPGSADQPKQTAQPTAAGDLILTGQHLTRRYPGRPAPALDDVDVNIRAGTSLGIVGESGAGKSTLLRLLLGVDRPTSGQVRFAGQPLDRVDARDFRRQVQVVFQDPRSSLDPRMSVASIIAEPLRSLRLAPNREERARRVAEVLTAVGLHPDDGRRYPHEFSGGQRQRIAIARALAPRPRLLLADEPVGALDVSVRQQIVDLLRELVDRYGLTLVLVSHDLAVVSQLCAQVMVLRDGRVVESGATDRVLTEPADAYTRMLLSAVPRLPSDLEPLSDDGRVDPGRDVPASTLVR